MHKLRPVKPASSYTAMLGIQHWAARGDVGIHEVLLVEVECSCAAMLRTRRFKVQTTRRLILGLVPHFRRHFWAKYSGRYPSER